jgi:hypothetical protein
MAGISDGLVSGTPTDAIVVAEAVAAPPSLILTSDPDDISRLIEAAGVAEDEVTFIAV